MIEFPSSSVEPTESSEGIFQLKTRDCRGEVLEGVKRKEEEESQKFWWKGFLGESQLFNKINPCLCYVCPETDK